MDLKTFSNWFKLTTGVAFAATAGSAQAAKIIDFYPNCPATKSEAVTLVNPLVSANGVVSYDTKEAMRNEMLIEIVELAEKKQFDAVILNDIKVQMPASKKIARQADSKFRMKMEAEFINYCEDDQSFSKKLTPYDGTGNRQFGLGGLTFEEQQVVIRQPGTEQKDVPALASGNISIDEGLYGVKLGTSKEKVKQKFGYPTAEFKLSSDVELHAYGRGHWFYFENKQLTQITTSNHYFNRNLINIIPFDDRFDDTNWKLYSAFEKDTKKQDVNLSSLKTSAGNTALTPLWRLNNAQEDVLNGFTYKMKHFKAPSLSKVSDTKDYAWLLDYVDAGQLSAEDLDNLLARATGKIYTDRLTITYVFDEYMLLEVVNGKLRQATLADNMFKTNHLNKNPEWRFAQIQQNASHEKVSQIQDALLPSANTMHMGDAFLVNTANYSVKYHFYEDQEHLKLYQLSFSVF